MAKKSCFGCYYENNNKCHWFEIVKNSTPKAIPKETLDKGCSKYKNTNIGMSESELLHQIIKLIDGEIISNKCKERIYIHYKKKTYKSSHNYTYRRDAQ